MAKHKEYQGHESYSAWNVALWINNTEHLYFMARDLKRTLKSSVKTAQAMLEVFDEVSVPYLSKESYYLGVSKTPDGVLKTPDGIRYTKHTIRLAIGDLHPDG
jgi:hypothetical protein